MKKIFVFIICFTFPLWATAQKIDNTASFRDIKSSDYFRWHYDNDYFTASDYYYTQGYNFELVAKALAKNPINVLLIKPKTSQLKYGLSFEHIGFTPTSILSNDILYGDRPFAAAVMLKSFVISTDTLKKTRLSSSLSIGIIGPGAFGRETQAGIHKWVDDDEPLGWQHQIKNDVLLNYELAHETQLLKLNEWLALNSDARLRLGTVNTNISGGLNSVFGKINSAFGAVKNEKKFLIYGYAQSRVSLIGYDATLQGGIFNRSSPYTIPNSDISRVTLQHNFGVVMQFKNIYLEYSRSEISREFKSGNPHRWGGFRIGFKL